MKKTCCPALLLLLAAYASPLEAADQKPGELIIKFRSTAKSTEVGKGIKAARLRIKKHLSARQTDAQEEDVVSLAETTLPVEEALQLLKDNPAIEYAEPNHTYTHQVSSNDPYASNGSLWGAYGDLSSPSNACIGCAYHCVMKRPGVARATPRSVNGDQVQSMPFLQIDEIVDGCDGIER